MADLLSEILIPLCDVAARYPARDGRRKHVGVVRRWVCRGVAKIRLEAVRLAGQWYTSEQALARFHAAVERARAERGPVGCAAASARGRQLRERTEAQRRKGYEAAKRFNARVMHRPPAAVTAPPPA